MITKYFEERCEKMTVDNIVGVKNEASKLQLETSIF